MCSRCLTTSSSYGTLVLKRLYITYDYCVRLSLNLNLLSSHELKRYLEAIL